MRNGEGKLILDGEGSNNRGEERKMRHGNPPFNSVTYLCRTGETVKLHCLFICTSVYIFRKSNG